MSELNNWRSHVERWKSEYGCKVRPPVDKVTLDAVEVQLGCRLPRDLRELYTVSNGLRYDWFAVLPIEDPRAVKQTWDGLLRANRPANSRFLRGQSALFERFVVFAEIGGERCALFSRVDGTLWFEEVDEFSQTDLSFQEFIDKCLGDAAGNARK